MGVLKKMFLGSATFAGLPSENIISISLTYIRDCHCYVAVWLVPTIQHTLHVEITLSPDDQLLCSYGMFHMCLLWHDQHQGGGGGVTPIMASIQVAQ